MRDYFKVASWSLAVREYEYIRSITEDRDLEGAPRQIVQKWSYGQRRFVAWQFLNFKKRPRGIPRSRTTAAVGSLCVVALVLIGARVAK